MLSRHAARQVVGIVGNVISFALFLSPCPTFYKIVKNKDVEGFKPDPYLATVLNCLMWVFYGMPFVHPDSLLVITINGVGLGLELIYLAIYFAYTDGKGRKKVSLVLLGEVVFMVAVVVGTMLGAHTHVRRSMIVGILCVIFNVCMYASPLTVMGKVIKTKSVEYMPFWLSLTNCVNGIIWTAYALIQLDVYMLISNGLGALSGIVQLALYAWYWRSTPVSKDDGVKRAGIQLSSSAV